MIKDIERKSDKEITNIKSKELINILLDEIKDLKNHNQVLSKRIKKLAQENLQLTGLIEAKPLSEICIAKKYEYGILPTNDYQLYPWLTKQDKIIDDLLKEIESLKTLQKDINGRK